MTGEIDFSFFKLLWAVGPHLDANHQRVRRRGNVLSAIVFLLLVIIHNPSCDSVSRRVAQFNQESREH